MALNLASIGYAGAVAVHLLLLWHLVRRTAGGVDSDAALRMCRAAVLASAAWAAALGLGHAQLIVLTSLADWLDLLRYALWFAYLWVLLTPPRSSGDASGIQRPLGWTGRAALALVATAAWLLTPAGAVDSLLQAYPRARIGAWLALAVFGLVLVEQLFRSQPEDSRWNAKPVCLALGCVFVYDVYLHAEALMFGRFDADALEVRGAVHTLAVPLIWVGSRRHAAWVQRMQVSRTAAFYSATLLLVGAYLLFMAGVGYYVRFFGGSWGRALQLAMLFAALALLAAMLFSGAMRARLRVFLGKNFFRYRYDYRQEWLRFTDMLSTRAGAQEVGQRVVRGLADMIECSGGALWLRGLDDSRYAQVTVWSAPVVPDTEPQASEFCAFMRQRDWIIDLAEYRRSPRVYEQLALPRWLLADATAWAAVPLRVADDMIGFVVLCKPRTALELNWEVRDLLKTASRQAASYLALMHATEALLEARKFDAFNRMSAFVVHDLKNIITQLSLMMKNAERHRDNPEFQQDMLLTVESSLEKMRQMMLQLREGARPPGGASGVELEPIARGIESMARGRGRVLELEIVDAVATRGHEDRMARVLGHVVQNALDATPPSGRVWLRLQQSSGRAMVVVGDTGEGMSPEFVQTRLFRPFSTTKHSGMGIGSYESFQYIKELGGSIEVDSEVGRGTVITILLPLFDRRKQSDLALNGVT
ncbi:MAG: PEP-CTERM system histidine kinase PrsK [Aquabacterium sp.]|nr:PEP-CTERM system histidine kinase PrsK [Aquabacterium sp.]